MSDYIRNISQTVQEREIIKTAPDIVVYLDGLPYLLNYFIDDPNAKTNYSIVNFNDHVTAFNAAYDVDLMIPSCSIGLQVPNFQKHLYQMPGGNNLIQTMMEVQVFCKGYFLANNGDTVYRRVFKGLVSHIGYNDNGRTLEISVQCLGTLHLLELMQINLNPSVQAAISTGVGNTVFASIFANKNPYQILASLLTYGLNSAGFQQTNLSQETPAQSSDRFHQAVSRGYIAKWQAILNNVAKDIHIYGTSYKDHPDKSKTKQSDTFGSKAKNELPATVYLPDQTEPEQQNDLYYGKIRSYLPDMAVTDINLLNSKIVSRMEYIRQMIHAIAFEGYQDVDGKIIIKPPLYNLDVTQLGPRDQSTSPTPEGSGDPYSALTNPLTEIHEETNPFVVHLSEILTENETEDQAAIRKTRMTCMGNIMPGFQINYVDETLAVGEWVDIPKLQKFGLREEPTVKVPWLSNNKMTLSAHAVSETVRANRGYRTYSITIPIRPELKLGFPMYIPHKDMYGYIKSINIQYQVGGSATMSVMLDSIRRRVLIPRPAVDKDGASFTRYESAGNLVYKWAQVKSVAQNTVPNPNQSPGNNLQYFQDKFRQISSGSAGTTQQQLNPADPTGAPATTGTTPDVQPNVHDNILQTLRSQRMATSWTMQPDTPGASYIVVPDGSQKYGTVDSKHPDGFFTKPRSVDNSYFVDIWSGAGSKSVIPFTDEKGYEVLAPFPWGRWQSLRTAIKEFTLDGYIVRQDNDGNQVVGPTDVNGNPTQNQQDISVLNTTESFLFAGLGTPTATLHPSNQLMQNLAQLQNQADIDTVVVLDYSDGQSSNDNQLLDKAQPDIANSAVENTLAGTSNANQQLIDVLVTGAVSPIKNPREVMQNVDSPPPQKSDGKPSGKTASQFANQNPKINPGEGSTATQNTQQLDQYKGT